MLLMKALIELVLTEFIRQNHGRTNLGRSRKCPDMDLGDRAMGITYLQGLHEAIMKAEKSEFYFILEVRD